MPARVFGLDSQGKPVNQAAWTVDISRRGARLRGLECWEAPGETIGVRHGTEKARYKVVWVGQRGTALEGQVGLVCLDTGRYIWGVAPPGTPVGAEIGATAPRAAIRPPIGTSPVFGGRNNRRKEARYRAQGGVKIQEIGAKAGQWTMLHDISMGGCYMETTTPLPPGSRVEAVVHSGNLQITAKGEVTVMHKLVGMGVQFSEMSALNRERLSQLMAVLVETAEEA